MLWQQNGEGGGGVCVCLQTHFEGSGKRQHTNNKGEVEEMCNIVILKRLYMHDLATNLSGKEKNNTSFFSFFIAPESAPLLAKQAADLKSDTVIMQSLLYLLSSHLHLLMHSASPVQFLKMAIKSNTISRKLIIVSLTTSHGVADETAAESK